MLAEERLCLRCRMQELCEPGCGTLLVPLSMSMAEFWSRPDQAGHASPVGGDDHLDAQSVNVGNLNLTCFGHRRTSDQLLYRISMALMSTHSSLWMSTLYYVGHKGVSARVAKLRMTDQISAPSLVALKELLPDRTIFTLRCPY